MSDLSFTLVVITRNRPEMLRRCLQCVAELTQAPEQIVVVDSSDNLFSADVVREAEKPVQYVYFRNGRNQMPTSRNIGLGFSQSAITGYIDDDCMVDEQWLSALLEVYRQEPEVAGVGGCVKDPRWTYDPSQPIGKVDHSGRVSANFFGDPGGPVEVDILPGGNMSFRTPWLRRVGGFDPGYVATNHREDPDLCLRIRAMGGRLVYQPSASLNHLHAKLTELKPWHEFFLRYSFERNEAYFTIKNFGDRPAALWRLFVEDTARFLGRVARARSLVLLATVPVALGSKALGTAAGSWARLVKRKKRNQVPSA